MGLLEKIFGNYSEKEIKKIKPIVSKIEALGPEYENSLMKNSEAKHRNSKTVWQKAKLWTIFCRKHTLL